MFTAKETGARIKARRQELRMTQDQLAEKIGYHGKSAISHIEKGDFDMSQSKIVAIAGALDTTVDYILGLENGGEIVIEHQMLRENRPGYYCAPRPPKPTVEAVLTNVDMDLLQEMIQMYLKLSTADKVDVNQYIESCYDTSGNGEE